MRLHYLQHVAFEDLANIKPWAGSQGFTISRTQLFNREIPPLIDDIDWLLVMGGPMSVRDSHVYPWLTAEKKLIEQAIARNKTVIGICLGAQLIAEVLGAAVFRNPHKEIGWFEVQTLAYGNKQNQYFQQFPDTFTAFHWHGDTFNIPRGARHLMRSKGCENQAFVFQNRIFAFQFHLESTVESVAKLVSNCRLDITPDPFVQNEDDILNNMKHFSQMHKLLGSYLDNLAKSTTSHSSDL